MKLPEVRFAEFDDIEIIASKLRMSDSVEIAAQHGMGASNLAALRRAFMHSPDKWTIEMDGVPVAMFGIMPAEQHDLITAMSAGSPWLLGTPAFERLPPRWLVKTGRKFVKIMLKTYPYLYNFIYWRNERSIKWLSVIGFRVYVGHAIRLGRGTFYAFDVFREELKDV